MKLMHLGVTPNSNAITTIIIALVAVAVATAAVLSNRGASASIRREASAR
jgi:ABC-type spermidine/putrescine transport system permease subunit II